MGEKGEEYGCFSFRLIRTKQSRLLIMMTMYDDFILYIVHEIFIQGDPVLYLLDVQLPTI